MSNTVSVHEKRSNGDASNIVCFDLSPQVQSGATKASRGVEVWLIYTGWIPNNDTLWSWLTSKNKHSDRSEPIQLSQFKARFSILANFRLYHR